MLATTIELNALGLSAAFAAGFVSFVSPCVWPLVPAYLTYVSGVAFADLADQRRRVTVAACAFVLGFGIVFTLAGVGAGIAGDFFTGNRRSLEVIAGIVVVVMGAALMGLAGTGFLQREKRVQLAHRPSGTVGAVLAGSAFAIGWTPCIGAPLTAILTVAGRNGGALDGAILLAVYSLGLGLPFVVTALFVSGIADRASGLRRHSVTVTRLAGALLVVMGVLLASGQLNDWTQQLATVSLT